MPTKRIIVTGGSGKAGHWIIKHLVEEGYEVVNVDNRLPAEPLCQTLRTDLTDFGQVVSAFSQTGAEDKRPYDGVIHMAAIPRMYETPSSEVFRINALGAFNVLEACSLLGIKKVVLASSECSYGMVFADEFFEPQYLPLDEEHPTLPQDAYGLSKVVNEVTADAYHRRNGMQILSFRIGNVLTPEEHAEVRAGFDKPENRKIILWSYIDCRDLATACRLGIEKDGLGCQPVLIAADDVSSDRDSMDLVKKYLPSVKEFKKPIQGRETLLSNQRLKDLLGWEQKHFLISD